MSNIGMIAHQGTQARAWGPAAALPIGRLTVFGAMFLAAASFSGVRADPGIDHQAPTIEAAIGTVPTSAVPVTGVWLPRRPHRSRDHRRLGVDLPSAHRPRPGRDGPMPANDRADGGNESGRHRPWIRTRRSNDSRSVSLAHEQMERPKQALSSAIRTVRSSDRALAPFGGELENRCCLSASPILRVRADIAQR